MSCTEILKILKWLPPYTCTVVVTFAILYLTLWPDPLPRETRLFEGADKIVHAIMFLGLYWALGLDFALSHGGRPFWRGGILLVTASFGALVEILQWMMGLGRSADTLDFVADVAGALIAALTLNSVLRWLGISSSADLPKIQSKN